MTYSQNCERRTAPFGELRTGGAGNHDGQNDGWDVGFRAHGPQTEPVCSLDVFTAGTLAARVDRCELVKRCRSSYRPSAGGAGICKISPICRWSASRPGLTASTACSVSPRLRAMDLSVSPA